MHLASDYFGESPSKQRYAFIDLYRTAVIILMLEGHVLRTFLPQQVQLSDTFQLHEFFHGISAPAFLFGAGLTFVISTRKRWEAYHHWGTALARRVKRFLMVIMLGVVMHLPFFSFRRIMIEGTAEEYLRLFSFDVLHCIGIGMLLLHSLIFFFKSESRFYGLVFLTIIAVCFLTPLVWDVDFLAYFPAVLAQMFNGVHGSPFPLFPFAGFLFAGVIVSWEFMVAAEHGSEKKFMRRLALIGVLLAAGGLISDYLPLKIYPTYNFWFTSPAYFFIRIGLLMVLTAGFWFIGSLLAKPPRILTVLGIESLFVYVLHLVILFGSAFNPMMNLRTILGTDLSIIQTAGVFLLLTFFMLITAYAWSILKERYFNIYRLMQIASCGVFLYLFFTRDF